MTNKSNINKAAGFSFLHDVGNREHMNSFTILLQLHQAIRYAFVLFICGARLFCTINRFFNYFYILLCVRVCVCGRCCNSTPADIQWQNMQHVNKNENR